ncbi:unnamed protein product [Vitrella brassicaformis CCMP3155]|uniref:Uncharacterized protein n=2 Tax=Vitrella brassicaformis TaxID=1169539 RepID=A0A0G4GGI3_VITBC|nr:unnamed protein product [Vitrella brassicaformis CCMP3155]|eukprot:CEM28746.1 unnamed protein product [Vitrella brassicaformis CCMP3155]
MADLWSAWRTSHEPQKRRHEEDVKSRARGRQHPSAVEAHEDKMRRHSSHPLLQPRPATAQPRRQQFHEAFLSRATEGLADENGGGVMLLHQLGDSRRAVHSDDPGGKTTEDAETAKWRQRDLKNLGADKRPWTSLGKGAAHRIGMDRAITSRATYRQTCMANLTEEGMREELQRWEAEKTRLLQDLDAARVLAKQWERQADDLKRTLTEKDEEISQWRAHVTVLKRRVQGLSDRRLETEKSLHEVAVLKPLFNELATELKLQTPQEVMSRIDELERNQFNMLQQIHSMDEEKEQVEAARQALQKQHRKATGYMQDRLVASYEVIEKQRQELESAEERESAKSLRHKDLLEQYLKLSDYCWWMLSFWAKKAQWGRIKKEPSIILQDLKSNLIYKHGSIAAAFTAYNIPVIESLHKDDFATQLQKFKIGAADAGKIFDYLPDKRKVDETYFAPVGPMTARPIFTRTAAPAPVEAAQATEGPGGKASPPSPLSSARPSSQNSARPISPSQPHAHAGSKPALPHYHPREKILVIAMKDFQRHLEELSLPRPLEGITADVLLEKPLDIAVRDFRPNAYDPLAALQAVHQLLTVSERSQNTQQLQEVIVYANSLYRHFFPNADLDKRFKPTEILKTVGEVLKRKEMQITADHNKTRDAQVKTHEANKELDKLRGENRQLKQQIDKLQRQLTSLLGKQLRVQRQMAESH